MDFGDFHHSFTQQTILTHPLFYVFYFLTYPFLALFSLDFLLSSYQLNFFLHVTFLLPLQEFPFQEFTINFSLTDLLSFLHPYSYFRTCPFVSPCSLYHSSHTSPTMSMTNHYSSQLSLYLFQNSTSMKLTEIEHEILSVHHSLLKMKQTLK